MSLFKRWRGYSDFKEKDRDIKDNYIDGEMSYVSKNMDGSLAVSSGSGGSWGKFVKKEKGAKIDFTILIHLTDWKKKQSGKRWNQNR